MTKYFMKNIDKGDSISIMLENISGILTHKDA